MEQKNQMLRKIESLSEQEKMELFNVEELETRLEMVSGLTTSLWNTNSGCANGSCLTDQPPLMTF
jgi:hypothetical protein